jgi:hypothetical protein
MPAQACAIFREALCRLDFMAKTPMVSLLVRVGELHEGAMVDSMDVGGGDSP